jgi:hypothetical protein
MSVDPRADGGAEGAVADPASPRVTRVRHLEIACDESGFSGGSLVGSSPVFTHASVHLGSADAAATVEDLRRRIGAPSGEFKASRLLRARHRPALLWLLGPDSPVPGHARVHLTDTRFFVVARAVEVLLGDGGLRGTSCPGRDPRLRPAALVLHRRGEACLGTRRWLELLTLAANLLRTNNRWLPRSPEDAFYAAVDELADRAADPAVREVLTRLRPSRAVAMATRAELLANPKLTPLLEPLIPALTRTATAWTSVTAELTVVHDEQSALTPERIADIAGVVARHGDGRLLEVRRVDSRDDPGVQVADFVAGIARRIGHDVLAGRPDPELVALLAPLVDPQSVWVHPAEPVGPASVGVAALLAGANSVTEPAGDVL